MKYRCRTYHQDDLETLRGLMLELGYRVELTELRHNIDEIYHRGGEIFIADKGGQAVGSVCVVLDVRLAEGVYAEIVSLVVSEKARGDGIGKALVREAEIWASRRARKIRVRANEVRAHAHTFYKKQGYEEIKTQKIFVKRV